MPSSELCSQTREGLKHSVEMSSFDCLKVYICKALSKSGGRNWCCFTSVFQCHTLVLVSHCKRPTPLQFTVLILLNRTHSNV